MKDRVIVIGGGAVGLFCAYHLAKGGHSVTVLERGHPGQENCSYGNAGMIVPSHFTPLASPGMLRLGLKMILKRNAPLAIRKPFSAETAKWIFAFLRVANATQVAKSEPYLRDLNLESKRVYLEFARDHDIGLSTTGLLMICKTEEALHEEARALPRAHELGLRAVKVDRHELQTLEPEIKIEAAGAILYEDDAFVSPTRVMAALTDALKELGVTRHFGCEVRGGIKDGKRLESVTTGNQSFEADRFILAAGAWSGRVGRQLGLNLNLLPGKGYGFWATRGSVPMRHCAILVEARVAVAPMPDGLRCTGGMEIGSFDNEIDQGRLQAVRQAVGNYLPDFAQGALDAQDIWIGHRPCSPTGLPYVGPSREIENLSLATGHGMMGMSLAAGSRG